MATIANGKISSFGGPFDKGVSPDEGLALYEPSQIQGGGGLFLPVQPPDTTGMARRLDPRASYCAMRWDYGARSKEELRNSSVVIIHGSVVVLAKPVDWGPNVDTGRLVDVSPAVLEELGSSTDDVVTVILAWNDRTIGQILS